MSITQNASVCNSAEEKSPSASMVGNIIPHWWYSKIVTNNGKSDTVAISLLSELWFLYRSSGEKKHQKDYSFFSKKFNLTQFQIRSAFIRLEAIGLMQRSVGTIIVVGRKFNNTLFVELNVKKLLSLAPGFEWSPT